MGGYARRPLHRVIMSFTLSCFTAFCSSSVLSAQSRVVRDGVAVEFSSQPLKRGHIPPGELRQGVDAIVRFSITDAATGTPVSGVQPVAWMELLADGKAAAKVMQEDAKAPLLAGLRSVVLRPILTVDLLFGKRKCFLLNHGSVR